MRNRACLYQASSTSKQHQLKSMMPLMHLHLPLIRATTALTQTLVMVTQGVPLLHILASPAVHSLSSALNRLAGLQT